MVQGRVENWAGDRECRGIENDIINLGLYSNNNKNPWKVFKKKADMSRFTFYNLILAKV